MASFLQPAAEKRKILNDKEHKIKFAPVVHTIRKSQSSLLAQWVKYPALSVICLGHCCGSGLILGPGTSACLEHSQKKKMYPKKTHKNHKVLVCVCIHTLIYMYICIYIHITYTHTHSYICIYIHKLSKKET